MMGFVSMYQTVYRITDDMYYVLLIVPFAILCGTFVLKFVKFFSCLIINHRNKVKISKAEKGRYVISFVLCLIVTIFFSFTFITQTFSALYYDPKYIIEPYKSGKYDLVIGEVDINADGSFSVESICFNYSAYYEAGYHKKSNEKYITQGKLLKIYYISDNGRNIIVQIDEYYPGIARNVQSIDGIAGLTFS